MKCRWRGACACGCSRLRPRLPRVGLARRGVGRPVDLRVGPPNCHALAGLTFLAIWLSRWWFLLLCYRSATTLGVCAAALVCRRLPIREAFLWVAPRCASPSAGASRMVDTRSSHVETAASTMAKLAARASTLGTSSFSTFHGFPMLFQSLRCCSRLQWVVDGAALRVVRRRQHWRRP